MGFAEATMQISKFINKLTFKHQYMWGIFQFFAYSILILMTILFVIAENWYSYAFKLVFNGYRDFKGQN